MNPFVVRGDLRPRYVPLESLAEAVRPGTALVAFSAVQSADGRTADLAAVREAAAAHGARTLVDATQAVGWLPFDAGLYDYTVTGAYKWLLCPRGTQFLTVTEAAQESLVPLHGGWLASADGWHSTYGPLTALAPDARRFDEGPAFLAYHGAAARARSWRRRGSRRCTPTTRPSPLATARGSRNWAMPRCPGRPPSWPCPASAGAAGAGPRQGRHLRPRRASAGVVPPVQHGGRT